MNSAQHAAEAERLSALASRHSDASDSHVLVTAALVHAQLAAVTLEAEKTIVGLKPEAIRAWNQFIYPPPPGPILCGNCGHPWDDHKHPLAAPDGTPWTCNYAPDDTNVCGCDDGWADA